MQKVLEELAPAFGKTIPGQFADHDLATLPYLDAVIMESLRVAAPGGSNAPRTTPPEGITVEGVFIPGNVKVFTPNYAFGRSEKFWVEPDSFIPERWIDRPDLIIDGRANFPFFHGMSAPLFHSSGILAGGARKIGSRVPSHGSGS